MNQQIDNILDEQKKFQQLIQPYKAAIKNLNMVIVPYIIYNIE